MSDTIQPRFEAFISYRHVEPDMTVAKTIHRQLETYRIPAYIKKVTGKQKMGRVFRDQDELPLLTDLGEGIRDALRASAWLIVVCTPDLLKSRWCMAEIDYFIALGRRDRILTVLVSGEPEESFPAQLRFVDGEEREPLAADVRAASTAMSLRKVRGEKLRLLAPMLGVGYDDLKRRQRERFLRTVAGVSAAAAIAAVGAGAYVLTQNRLLAEQRNIAVQNESWATTEKNNALISQSKFLSGLSGDVLVDGDPGTAMLLALEALPQDLDNPDRPLVEEAVVALRNTDIARVQQDYRLAGGVAQQSGTWRYLEKEKLLVYIDLTRIYCYDLPSGALVYESVRGMMPEGYCPARSLLVKSYKDKIELLDLATFTTREIASETEVLARTWTNYVQFTDDGKYLMRGRSGGDTNYYELIEIDTGRSLYCVTDEELVGVPGESSLRSPYFSDIALSPDGRYFAYCLGRAVPGEPYVFLMDLLTGAQVRTFAPTQETAYNLLFSPDGTYLCVQGGRSYGLDLFLVESGALVGSFDPVEAMGSSYQNEMMFSPDSRVLGLRTGNDRAFAYATDTGELIAENTPELGPVVYMGFTDERTMVVRRGITSPEIYFFPLDGSPSYTVTIPDLHGADALGGEAHSYSTDIQMAGSSFVCYSAKGVYQLWQKREATGGRQLGQVLSERDNAKAYSPDGRRFALGQENTVTIYDTDTCTQLAQMNGAGTRFYELIWSPDGTRLLGSDMVSNVWLWETQSGTEIHYWKSKYTSSPFEPRLFVAPDWSCFALNNPGHIGGVYDMASGERRFDFSDYEAMSLTGSATFTTDSRYLYVPVHNITEEKVVPEGTGAPQTVRTVYSTISVLDAMTGAVARQLSYDAVEGTMMSPDERWMIFQDDGTKEHVLLDLQTGEERWRARLLSGTVTWSPDSSRFAVSVVSPVQTMVYNTESGARLGQFAADMPAFSADARYLCLRVQPIRGWLDQLVGGYRGEVYDLTTGQLFAILPKPGIFSRDGRYILTQDSQWENKTTAQLMARAREKLQGRELNARERARFYLD